MDDESLTEAARGIISSRFNPPEGKNESPGSLVMTEHIRKSRDGRSDVAYLWISRFHQALEVIAVRRCIGRTTLLARTSRSSIMSDHVDIF
jgi:hypothetical protein